MDSKMMKNIVVLKDLPSNIIDEAIVILKSNCKIKSLETTDKNKKTTSKGKNDNSYVLNEAEMIINNYISDIKEEKKVKSINIHVLEKKCKKLKTLLMIVGTIAFSSIVAQII